jgi:hypothetical protein
LKWPWELETRISLDGFSVEVSLSRLVIRNGYLTAVLRVSAEAEAID